MSQKKKNKLLIVLFSILSCVIILASVFLPIIYTAPKANMYILHASGFVNHEEKTYSYLNIIDTFEEAYNNGHRFFEYDFVITSDNKLVGSHYFEYINDYGFDNRISYEEYTNTKILGEYSGLTIANLIPMLIKYPDTYIVVDTKEKEYVNFYSILVSEIKNFAPDGETDVYINRFIPQLYNKQMWLDLKDTYTFDQYIFTNYKAQYSTSEIMKYFSDERIRYITLYKFNMVNCNLLYSSGKKLLFHTVNDKFTAGALIRFKNAHGFYTDKIKDINF